MEEKIMVMTSFGPVPFDAVKEYLPKEALEAFEASKEEMLEFIDAKMRMELEGEDYYIYRLAKKKGWEPRKMYKYIENLTKFSPIAAALVLLREIAVDFDDTYEGHIEDSEEIWTISMLNGEAEQVDKSKVKNYRNFPAFRSREDAREAHEILSKRLRKMFRGCGE